MNCKYEFGNYFFSRSFFRLKTTTIMAVPVQLRKRGLILFGFLHTGVEIELLFDGGVLFFCGFGQLLQL
jgi:hypothetical protein